MATQKIKSARKMAELKVVFDTSILFTGSASDLVREEVREIVSSNSQHGDLAITWCLPEVVVLERTFQMRQQAMKLLPSIRKLERLLGHNLNITEEIVEQRIEKTIQEQLDQMDMEVLPLEASKVDLRQLMKNSASRTAPFSDGEHEKGFRDALIVEIFLQLVEKSPVTPAICRVALVAGDTEMTEAVEARTRQARNVRLLSSESLKGLINTLVAKISEEYRSGSGNLNRGISGIAA